MENLVVYPENMLENLGKTKGLIFSQRVLLALVEKDIYREEAYEIVQEIAMTAWETGQNFKELLLRDERVLKYLKKEDIEACFDYNYYLKNINNIFANLEERLKEKYASEKVK